VNMEQVNTEKADPLKLYKQRQQALGTLVEQYRGVAAALESDTHMKAAAALAQSIASSSFRVLVLGEFKRGKSTLINAMLGHDLLPADVAPCTAVVTEVRYADKARVIVHPRDGSLAFEIPADRLAKMITIDEDVTATESPYRLVEIYWPFELCRDGVVIVDSPGLNEDSIRSHVTGGYLDQADAILFMSSATAPFSESEQNYLRTFVLPLGHEDIFFVYSRIDDIAPGQRARLKAIAIQRVSTLRADSVGQSGLPKEPRVFFVNGQGALEARLAGDSAAAVESGLTTFEDALRLFLTSEKGRVKLMRPMRELRGRIAESRALVRDRDLMYDQELTTLTNRYEAERPRLELLEQRRRIIVASLRDDVRAVEAVVEDAARQFLGSLPAKCPGCAAEAELEHRVRSLFKTEEQAADVVAELTGVLGAQLQAELLDWQAESLRPLLKERLTTIRGSLNSQVADFLSQVGVVRAAITGGGPEDASTAETSLDRLLGALPDSPLTDTTIEVTDAKIGTNTLLGAVLPQVGVLIAGLLLTFSTAGIAAMMLGTGILQAVGRIANINQSMKVMVGETVAGQLKLAVPDQARIIGREIGDKLRSFADQVDRSLLAQTDTVREQVEATIRDLRAGQERVAERRNQLRDLTAEIEQIERDRGVLDDQINAT
jgi:hypothetical protein